MGINAVMLLILVQDEVKSFRVIATLVLFIPLQGCRLEVRHQLLGHFT